MKTAITTARRCLAAAAAAALLCGCGLGEPRIDYAQIAAGMPDLDDLAERATSFRSTLIYDREGNLLNEAFDPRAGRRTVVPLERISPYLRLATIATEDARYYEHGGVDPVAVARAAWYLVREGEAVSGASTIPQQLAKRLYLTSERSVRRKVTEAALAAEISQRYSKDQILELYLNEIFYGNLAYGVQAAARAYFGKDAADLSLAESALLAGLPQAPAYYDPYANPERAKRRQEVVLGLMVKTRAVSRAEAEAAAREPLAYVEPRFDLRAPHFTLYVREQIEALFGPEALYSRGLAVRTTLDPRLQSEAETAVAGHIAAIAARGAGNGALVAVRPATGEILAMVGSADYANDAISGQVNMALAPRQPGSAIKPFVYLTAFATAREPAGTRWTPATLLADIEEDFPDGANPPYRPTNYDLDEHGLVTVRDALANSYNIPAVRALQAVGIRSFLATARAVGITTLTRQDYGLGLALGAGEVPLVELTAAYAVLANSGRRPPATAITRIVDTDGDVLCQMGTERPCVPGALGVDRQQVVPPPDTFLITDILSDNAARVPAFGAGSYLEIDRPAAVKTGTTNDTRDGWTVGYVPQLAVGVWVGNADNSPMRGVSGYAAAAPIWNRVMRAALAGETVVPFTPPAGTRQFEVCADTGALPSPACPARRLAWFAEDRPPLGPEHDLWHWVNGVALKVYPERYRFWAEARGMPQPPPGWDDAAPTEEPTELPASPTVTATPTVSATSTVTATLPFTMTATPSPDVRFGTPGIVATPGVWPPTAPATAAPTAAPTADPGAEPTLGPPPLPATPGQETPPPTEPPPAPAPAMVTAAAGCSPGRPAVALTR